MMNPHMQDWFASGWSGRPRAQRGDVAPLLLRLLQEKPMHGYEIISTLEERSHGLWRPSPGSVYPTLQMLEEEGLLRSAEEGGRKIYHLTKDGEEAASHASKERPWKGSERTARRVHSMRREVARMIRSMRRIFHYGTDEQVQHARDLITEFSKQVEVLADKVEGGDDNAC